MYIDYNEQLYICNCVHMSVCEFVVCVLYGRGAQLLQLKLQLISI